MADAGREGGKPILRHSGGERSYVPSYTAFGAVAGVVVHGMVNAMRRRPVSYGACGASGRRATTSRLAAVCEWARAHSAARPPPAHPPPALDPAEPWWHVINAVAGATIMRWVAIKYDGTSAFMAGQMGSYAKMPTWAYDSLSDDELGACQLWRQVWAAAAARSGVPEA